MVIKFVSTYTLKQQKILSSLIKEIIKEQIEI